MDRVSRSIAFKGQNPIFVVDVARSDVASVSSSFSPDRTGHYFVEVVVENVPSSGAGSRPSTSGEKVIIYSWIGSTLKLGNSQDPGTVLDQAGLAATTTLASMGLHARGVDAFWVAITVDQGFSGSIVIESGPRSTLKTGKIRLPGT